MRKFIALSVILILLAFSPKIASFAKAKLKMAHNPIERIASKYDEISKNAPVIKANGKEVAKELRFIEPSDKVVPDYGKLRQIALVRHGEPDIEKTGKFDCEGACNFMKCYDKVCIIVPEKPFFDVSRDKDNLKVFSSPLNRAKSTAEYICGKDQEITVDPVFREFENKIKPSDSKRRLPIKVWTATARIKWMLGFGEKDIETFSQAKERARTAAEILDEASKENPKVLLTAHGMSNKYVKKNLKAMGWKVVEDTGDNYFGTTVLVKMEE